MNTQLIAFVTMSSIGIAAPAAAWYVNEPAPSVTSLHAEVAEVAELSAAGAEVTPEPPVRPEPVVVTVPNMVIVAPKPAPKPAPSAERRCSVHQTQIFDGGAVRVCGGERSDNDRADNPLVATHRFQRLAPRDLPSPSGLLRPAR